MTRDGCSEVAMWFLASPWGVVQVAQVPWSRDFGIHFLHTSDRKVWIPPSGWMSQDWPGGEELKVGNVIRMKSMGEGSPRNQMVI